MNTKRTAIIVVTALSLYFATTALGYTNQEKYQNNMAVPAYDLTKIIEGDINITSAIHDKFADHRVSHPQGTHTVIHFFDGKVEPQEKTWACFNTHPAQTVNVICALWTDPNGVIIGVAGPPVSSSAVNYLGTTRVVLRNSWVSWNGIGYPIQDGDGPGDPIGPITISDVAWAISDVNYPMEELNQDLAADWQSLDGDALNYGERRAYNLADLAEDTIVLFRFTATGAGQTSEEIIQFVVGPVTPTVSQWGLIVMAALLVLAGTIVIIRRRRQIAA